MELYAACADSGREPSAGALCCPSLQASEQHSARVARRSVLVRQCATLSAQVSRPANAAVDPLPMPSHLLLAAEHYQGVLVIAGAGYSAMLGASGGRAQPPATAKPQHPAVQSRTSSRGWKRSGSLPSQPVGWQRRQRRSAVAGSQRWMSAIGHYACCRGQWHAVSDGCSDLSRGDVAAVCSQLVQHAARIGRSHDAVV